MKPRAHNIAAAAQVATAVAAEVPGTVGVTPAPPAVVDTTAQANANGVTTAPIEAPPAPATPDLSHVTEAQAFAHPSVAKFIKDLETWYDEEIAKVKADAAKAVAFFKGDASPNDIHANNSIDAVNAASPAK